jgi:3'-phosphoadenosine 5'-phosphosulfate (PAPS) 3'-phosphatase
MYNPEKPATYATQDEENTKQTQSRETGSIGHIRRRKTKQTRSRETGNIGHTRRRKTKQTHSRETSNIEFLWIVFV